MPDVSQREKTTGRIRAGKEGLIPAEDRNPHHTCDVFLNGRPVTGITDPNSITIAHTTHPGPVLAVPRTGPAHLRPYPVAANGFNPLQLSCCCNLKSSHIIKNNGGIGERPFLAAPKRISLVKRERI